MKQRNRIKGHPKRGNRAATRFKELLMGNRNKQVIADSEAAEVAFRQELYQWTRKALENPMMAKKLKRTYEAEGMDIVFKEAYALILSEVKQQECF